METDDQYKTLKIGNNLKAIISIDINMNIDKDGDT